MSPRSATRSARSIVIALALALLAPGGIDARSASAATTPTRPLVRFDRPAYDLGECASITVTDSASNVAPGTSDSLTVRVVTEGDAETVQLVETGPDTGVFDGVACLPLSGDAGESGDGMLTAEPGAVIAAILGAADGKQGAAPRAMDIATIRGAEPTGQWDAQVDPAVLPDLDPDGQGPLGPDPRAPVAAMSDASGRVALFGEDQVVITETSEWDLQEFLTRRGGTVRETLEIPIPEKDQEPGYADVKRFHVVQLDPSKFDGDTAAWAERLGLEGTYRFSSEEALKLAGIVLEEQLGGGLVGFSTLGRYQAPPRSNEGVHGDAFTHAWFNLPQFAPAGQPAIPLGSREALTLLSVMDQRERGPQVGTAIIDGGFASPADYAAGIFGSRIDNRDYGVSFSTASRCAMDAFGAADCSPNAAGGPNPLTCTGGNPCPWHGTQMFSTAGAELHNGFGTTGIGAHVVNPMLYKVGQPYLTPTAGAIRRAVDDGARVISISSSFPCVILGFDLCTTGGALAATFVAAAICPLIAPFAPGLVETGCLGIFTLIWGIKGSADAMGAAIDFAESRDVVIVAGAGNDNDDTAGQRPIPCTKGAVVCVGSVGWDGARNVRRSGFSNFGSFVDIWGPGEGFPSTPAPDTQASMLDSTGGTSSATAYVSGTVAIIRSIDPSLRAAQVRNLLFSAACSSARPTVRLAGGSCTPAPGPVNPAGYVDVVEMIHQARRSARLPSLAPCTGGWEETTFAFDSSSSPRVVGGLTTVGSEQVFRGDLSIHALSGPGAPVSDEDWYRFRPPSIGGRPSADMTITLHQADRRHGVLAVELFESTGPGALTRIDRRTTAAGDVTMRHLFFVTRDYYVRVVADGDPVRNDACYGGSTLTFRVNAAGPRADAYELNDNPSRAGRVDGPWAHTHASRARQSTERWAVSVDDLSLHSTIDIDYFRRGLPDPTAAPDGHPGLQECGFETSIGEETQYSGWFEARIRTATPGIEAVRLHDPSRPTATDTPSGATLARWACPRTEGLREMMVSYGAGRERREAVAYGLDLEYKINIVRDVPAWVRELEALERGAFNSLGCPLGFFPGCGGTFGVSHPIDPSRIPGCLADGCGDWIPVNLERSGAFDVSFVGHPGLQFRLYDEEMNLVGQAAPPGFQSAVGDRAQQEDDAPRRLLVAQAKAGLHFLNVTGPASDYQVRVATVPTGQRSISFDASANRVKRGRRVTLAGLLDSANPACANGARVDLQAAPAKGGGFKRLATTKTSAGGAFRFRPRQRSPLRYRAVAPASTGCLSVTSAIVSVRTR